MIVIFLLLRYNSIGDTMKLIKSTIIFLLTAAVLITSIPLAFNAESEQGKVYPYITDVASYYSEVENYIAEQLREQKASIDISQYGVPRDDLIYIYRSVMFDNPDIFYVDASYIPYKFDRMGNIAILTPQYIFTRSKIPSYIKKFNSACKSYIKGIDSSMSDVQKALTLHDRIALGCKYKNENDKSFTAYNVLVTGKGVCEGYARAYSYLLSLVGVDSKCLNNESKGHLWNLVKIGGNWYHVDVTSDDPLPDDLGYVRHKYFLLSDAKLLNSTSGSHRGFKDDTTYSSAFSCSSTKYNSSFFRNITSQIVCYKKAYYYFNNNYKKKLYSALIKRKGSSKKVIKVIKDVWRYSNGTKARNSYCKLCELNSFIYFNSMRKIFRYNLKTGKTKRIMTLPSFIKTNYIGVNAESSAIYAHRKNRNLTKSKISKVIKVSTNNKVTVIPFLKYTKKTLKKGKSFKLKVYYGKGKITYKSSNTKVARVSSKGRVKAKKKGSCTITAVRSGKKMKCKVRVK